MIHAYDEIYLDSSVNILGHAFDFAVNTLGINIKSFSDAFLVSKASTQFGKGNPKYIAGMNGCELAREILDDVGMKYIDTEDIMYLDKSPEFWAGWALAYYQWYSGESFRDILNEVNAENILKLYDAYHEMDITHFVDYMDSKLALRPSKLKTLRTNVRYTQAALAKASGIPLRQIQLFEQKQRDINKTSADTLYRLSKALCCKMEDLLELGSIN